MKDEEQVLNDSGVQESDIEARLKESEKRIKELQLQENERRIKELERQAELAQRIADNISAPETQMRTPSKPTLRDPSAVYDEFFESRKNFEMTYGHGEKYNINDPNGLLKLKLVSFKRTLEHEMPEKSDEEIKRIILEEYKNELSML